MIAPKVTSYVTPTRHEAPPTTTRIITRVPTADEAREILRGDEAGGDLVSALKGGDYIEAEWEPGTVLDLGPASVQCGHRGPDATCTKAHGHVGEHAVHAHGRFGGLFLRRWASEESHDA